MKEKTRRISWDSNLKIYVKNDLHILLPIHLRSKISKSNICRWKKEPENKYENLGIKQLISQNLDFIQQTNAHPNLKRAFEIQLLLTQKLFSILANFKGLKNQICKHKESIVSCIENIKNEYPTKFAIQFFGLSYNTYLNYKTLVLAPCYDSPLAFCVRKFTNQLLKNEVINIKTYLQNDLYKNWSLSSIYCLGVRNKDFSFCLSTFYKYVKILGFSERKFKFEALRHPLKSFSPNHFWAVDVTFFKTQDHVKHAIHLLIDHFSKKILAFTIDSSPKAIGVKTIIEDALKQKDTNDFPILISDGGSENCNKIVKKLKVPHLVAQRDILSSNSCIESVNKILKHQFLYHIKLKDRKYLEKHFPTVVHQYNHIRPQKALGGNTPHETYAGKPIEPSVYQQHFATQQALRRQKNQNTSCKRCIS